MSRANAQRRLCFSREDDVTVSTSDRPTAFRLARFRGEPQKGTRWARRGGERRPRTSTAPGRPAGLRPRSHAGTRKPRRSAWLGRGASGKTPPRRIPSWDVDVLVLDDEAALVRRSHPVDRVVPELFGLIER